MMGKFGSLNAMERELRGSGRSPVFVISRPFAAFILLVFVTIVVGVALIVHFSANHHHHHHRKSHTNKTAKADATLPEVQSSPSGAANESTAVDVRLPRHVLPRHYEIRLLPWLVEENFTSDGFVRILIECVNQTDRIVLHVWDLQVDRESVKVALADSPQEHLGVADILEDMERQFFIVVLREQLLQVGANYTLEMKFVGQLNREMMGIYLGSYVENGMRKYMAMSQMEPVSARRAFPCFDEPNMKAKFTLTIGRMSNMTSISNMPKIKSTPIDGVADYEWDWFETSVPMSTYLVAVVVADYSYVESKVESGGVTFRIWARHSAINQTKYGLDVGPRILKLYEDYFGIDFPLPKLDMIALPEFGGAMENWGLVTYGEQYLLYDPNVTAIFSREMVAHVIAHELAHQWFGNLVTMDWWSDLWLNEGFASYVTYIGANHVEPASRLFQQFIINEVQEAMRADALETSHPIYMPVHQLDDISQIFDKITYNKGATIIRMCSEFLGESTFKRGLAYYLKTHQYDNAASDDLWSALTHQAELDMVQLPTTIKAIMDSWTLKMGYPVVTVERNYSSRTATISQKRFLLYPVSPIVEDPTYRWWIPLTYTTDFNRTHSFWLLPNETAELTEIGVDETVDDVWIIFNINQVGFYRVNYDDRNWHLISKQLESDHTIISVINRAQIIDDAFSFSQTGLLDYEITLNLTRYLKSEREYLPWKSAWNSLKYIDSMLMRSPSYGLFQDYMVHLLTPLLEHVTFNGTDDDDPLLIYTRMNAISWACKLDQENCVQHSVRLYSAWMKDPTNNQIIPSNLKSIIACTAIRHGGKKEWDFANHRFHSTNVASEKADLLDAMGCSTKTWILSSMLYWFFEPSGDMIRIDSAAIVGSVARSPLGSYLASYAFLDVWDRINKRLGTAMPGLPYLIESITHWYNTPAELESLQRFRDQHLTNLSTVAMAFSQAIEKTQANIVWRRKNLRTITKWLRDETGQIAIE